MPGPRRTEGKQKQALYSGHITQGSQLLSFRGLEFHLGADRASVFALSTLFQLRSQPGQDVRLQLDEVSLLVRVFVEIKEFIVRLRSRSRAESTCSDPL